MARLAASLLILALAAAPAIAQRAASSRNAPPPAAGDLPRRRDAAAQRPAHARPDPRGGPQRRQRRAAQANRMERGAAELRRDAPRAAKGPAMADALIPFFLQPLRRRGGPARPWPDRQHAGGRPCARPRRHAPGDVCLALFLPCSTRACSRPTRQVDVHRVMGAAQLAEWREKGRYPFWRLGIGPDGTWHYFLGAE